LPISAGGDAYTTFTVDTTVGTASFAAGERLHGVVHVRATLLDRALEQALGKRRDDERVTDFAAAERRWRSRATGRREGLDNPLYPVFASCNHAG